jgi:hypothetical protein
MLVVFLELGALMRGNRVFQRQCVQAEFVAQTRDGLAVRRLEFDPDEAIRLADVIADIVECDRFGLGLGVAEEQAVDDGLRRRGDQTGILAAMRHASHPGGRGAPVLVQPWEFQGCTVHSPHIINNCRPIKIIMETT